MNSTLPPPPPPPVFVPPAPPSVPPDPPTADTEPGDPVARSLLSARWLAGVGVLLIAAAGVAMLTTRWDVLSDLTRLLIMVAGTGLTAGASRLLQPAAPTTGKTLFYLTAILAALDVGAIAVVGGAGWPGAALACGIAGFATAEAVRRALPGHPADLLFVAAGAVAVGGLAAVTGLPAALLALGLVVVALAIPDRTFAVDGWAALIALAPLVQVIDGTTLVGQGTLTDMGLLGPDLRWTALIAGIGAAGALGLRAHETRSWARLVLAVVSLALGGVTAWIGYHPPTTYLLPMAATGFVIIEVIGLTGHRAEGWGRWADGVADIAELAAAPVLSVALVAQAMELYTPDGQPDWTLAIAAFITAIGWLIGTARLGALRVGPAVPAAAMTIAGAMLLAAPAWLLGALILWYGILATGYATHRRNSGGVLWASLATTLGSWIVLVDLDVDVVEPYVLTTVLAILLAGELDHRRSWTHWTPALGLVTAAGVLGHHIGDSSVHTTFLAATGAGAAIWGGIRTQAAPLLLGTVLAIVAGGYQVLDATVGVAGWGWLALGGTAMVAVAALLESHRLPDGEHPGRLVADITEKFT